MQTKKYYENRTLNRRFQTWVLPMVVKFERMSGNYFYEVIGFRPPREGEYYLSGADIEAWQAFSNLDSPYLVVAPGEKAHSLIVWVPEKSYKPVRASLDPK